MGIDTPEHELVGRIDGEPVRVRDLDARSGNAFDREGQRIYQAREVAWRWLLERAALERHTGASGAALPAALRTAFATLPQPDDAELAVAAAGVGLAGIADPEDRAAARSVWRGQKWVLLRSLLVARGADGLARQRQQVDIFSRTVLDPAQAVATIGGRAITRAELRQLAADEEETVRREYVHLLRLQFDELVRERLRRREAERRGVGVPELLAAEAARAPPISAAEVKAFLKKEPGYAVDPRGAEKARDVLRRLRVDSAEKALDGRLRAAAAIEFHPREPELVRKQEATVTPAAPRRAGAAAGPLVVLYHGVACDSCAAGTRALTELLASRGVRIRLLAGDSFQGFAGYRGALALHCAAEQGRWTELLAALAGGLDRGAIGELEALAGKAGLDAAGFRRCLDEDRYLPDIQENALQARRLGIPPGQPGLFIDGVTVWDLDQPERLAEQLAKLLP